MQDFRKVIVWGRAQEFASRIYDLTETFPSEERFALTRQIRTAALSIPNNIAEGRGRSTDRDYAKFLWIALGSACELDSQLDFAQRRRLLPKECGAKLISEITEIRLMLYGLIRSLKE